jgi:tetratricopeptide (TPR) repeat protein
MASDRDETVQKAHIFAARGKFKKALNLYIKIGDFAGAASMHEKLGQTEQAIDCYARSGNFLRAAELLHESAEYEKAARMFARSGSPRRAAQALLEADKPVEAAKMFERAGDLEDAAKLYEAAGRFGVAASLYENCGMRDKAIQIYEENDRKELAARLCAQGGEFVRAARLYAEMEIFIEAARCFVRADMKEEAIEAFEKAGAYKDAIELCEEAGHLEKAAEYSEVTGDIERAVEFYSKAGKYARAGEAYERKLLYFQAARMYARERDTLSKAGELFKQTLSIDAIWNYETPAPVWDIAIAEQAGRIILGLASAEVIVLDKQGAFLWRFRIPMGIRCRSVAVTPDAARLAVGTQGRSIYMLDASNRLLWKREVGGEVRALAFADECRMLVAACTDGYVRVFHIDGKDHWSFQTEFKAWHLAVDDAKRQIVAGTGDGQLYVFDYEGQVVWKERTDDWIARIAISPGKQYVSMVLGQSKIRLYDLADRRLIWEQDHKDIVQDVTFWNEKNMVICTNTETVVCDFDFHVVCRAPSTDRVMRVRCGVDGETVYLGHFERGLEVIRLHDCIIRAARCFEENQNYVEAAELYEVKNELTSAAKMHASAGNYSRAAELSTQLGSFEQAGEFYERSGELEKAGECYERVNLLERAAVCYDGAGHKSKAGALLAGIGDTVRAAKLQMESGDYVTAGHLYQKAGALEDAQLAFELAAEEKTLTAEAAVGLGRLYYGNNRHDETIRLLQPFRSDPDQVRNVAKLLAECFVAKKQHNIAVDHYKEALAGIEDDLAGNIDTLYGLACALEMATRYSEAKEIFKKILLVDYYYRDVTGRIERIEEMSAIFRPSDDGTMQQTRALGTTPSGHNVTVAQSKPRRYEILRKLGEGGMGVVYEARDTKLDRIVAMKVLPSKFNGHDELKSRFVREARAVASLSHENVVAVYDIGEEWGESYIAMEFVDGFSLRDLLDKKKKLTIDQTVTYTKQIADGLAAAHKAGIVHRDIKPENVMIAKSSQQVKLMDFGLARMDTATNLTQEGSVMGTWRYMPPEQIRGDKITPAADIYATGIMIFEMITGRPPFGDGDIAFHHMNTTPEPLSEVEPAVPPALSDVVARCLAKRASDRYADGQELREALVAGVIGQTL